MLPSQVKAYKDRWQAVADLEEAERRRATVLLRWKQLNAILRLALGLQLPLEPAGDETQVYERWAALRRLFENTR